MSTAAEPAAPAVVECRVDVRWRDLDPLGHVGHEVFLTYLEAARNALLDAHGIAVDGYVVVSVSLDYRHEIRMGTEFVRGRCRIARVGTSSLATTEELHAPDGTLLAEGSVVLVLWDAAERRPRPVSDAERTSFARAMDGEGSALDHDREGT